MFTVHTCEGTLECFARSLTDTPGINKNHNFGVKQTEEILHGKLKNRIGGWIKKHR